MFSETDERDGLVKTNWNKIRSRVSKVEPQFTALVDELEPDNSFPIFLAYFPYGAVEADTQSSYLPKCKGGYYRLLDKNTPKEITKNLGYGKDSSPLGMVLEKELEVFIDLKSEGITIPWLMYKPGKFFPFARILSQKSHRTYSPNGLLSATAGARSAFMLPNIGCSINHSNLQRDFNVQSPPPKNLYEHWNVFREIINSQIIDCDWRCCVMYFSEKWVTKLHSDKAWQPLKQYLLELAWNQNEYERNRIYYDIIFSLIKKKRNLKPNPYLADTARHLFTTALGNSPGYSPALEENALPLKDLQKAFVDSYGLKKYKPVIMQPSHFIFEESNQPIYYSLQHPSTHIFSPKSREVSNTLTEMRELVHIMKIFIEELAQDNSICADTILGKISNEIKLSYYHNKVDRHNLITHTSKLPDSDKRFNYIHPSIKDLNGNFACDAPFVRGCISISRKKKKTVS